MPIRIVCVGNRFVAEDSLGPRVHDRLAACALPARIEVVDGGLQGLNLLGLLESADRVVLVDAVSGFADARQIVALTAAEVVASAPDRLDHGAGVGYLLGALAAVAGAAAPPCWLVGAAGVPDDALVDAVAARAVALAARGDA